jgi:methylmalonyl-CoA/ethylmalonyl-CoA epimerase
MSASTAPFSPLALNTIGQIALTVTDVPRAVTFYRDTLGMRFLFQPSPSLAFFMCGDIRLMLDKPEDPAFRNRASVIYYKVDDIHASFASLKERGVKVVDEPHLIARMPDHELWMTFFRDPDENLLALMSEVR